MMKKVTLCLLASIFALSTIGAPISANESRTDLTNNVVDSAPIIGDFVYDSDYALLVADKERLMEEYFEATRKNNESLAASLLNEFAEKYTSSVGSQSRVSVQNSSGVPAKISASYGSVPITQVPQQNGFYCGYAAIKSLLDAQGVIKSQDTIAGEVHSTSIACPWYLSNGNSSSQFPAVTYLNQESGHIYVPFPYGVADTTTITASDVKSRVRFTIGYGHGVLVCGRSYGNVPGHASILPGYPSQEIGHWVVLSAFTNDAEYINIVDPAKSSAVSWSGSISSSYYVAASKLAAYASARGIIW